MLRFQIKNVNYSEQQSFVPLRYLNSFIFFHSGFNYIHLPNADNEIRDFRCIIFSNIIWNVFSRGIMQNEVEASLFKLNRYLLN